MFLFTLMGVVYRYNKKGNEDSQTVTKKNGEGVIIKGNPKIMVTSKDKLPQIVTKKNSCNNERESENHDNFEG